jgi:chromosome partitioning protein
LKKLARREHACRVGILGMRVNARSRSADQLRHYAGQLGLPVLGYLRDTQNYIQLAAHGATLWDVAPPKWKKIWSNGVIFCTGLTIQMCEICD